MVVVIPILADETKRAQLAEISLDTAIRNSRSVVNSLLSATVSVIFLIKEV